MTIPHEVNGSSPPLTPRRRNESLALQTVSSNHGDAQSHTSTSNASSRLGEIVSQAARILKGENPNAAAIEEEVVLLLRRAGR